MTYYSYDGQASDSLQGALVVLHLSKVGYIWGPGTGLALSWNWALGDAESLLLVVLQI